MSILKIKGIVAELRNRWQRQEVEYVPYRKSSPSDQRFEILPVDWTNLR